MADDVSTASEPGMATPKENATTPDDINVSAAPAAVTWDDQELPLTGVTCDIRRYASTNTAFIKLRATVALKAPAPAKTSIFLFIHPERVRAVALGESPEPTSQEAVRRKLGQNTYCLHFTLDRPADLVGPAGSEHMAPKNKTSGETLGYLRSLARQIKFGVYLPAKVVTKAQLLSLCEVASDHRLKSVTWQADMSCLYGGKGGRLIADVPEASTTSPPSYNEVEPGPPLPPISYDSSAPGPSKKRRRESGDADSPAADLSAMEAMCRKIMGEMKAELKQDMSNQLQQLEKTLMERIEQRLAEESGRIEDEVDERLQEVREQTSDEIGIRIEDEYYGVRIALEEFVQDEMRDAEGRIMEHIESSATISLQFNA